MKQTALYLFGKPHIAQCMMIVTYFIYINEFIDFNMIAWDFILI